MPPEWEAHYSIDPRVSSEGRTEDPLVLLEARRFSFGRRNFEVTKLPEDTTTVRDSNLPFHQFVLALIMCVTGVAGITLIL